MSGELIRLLGDLGESVAHTIAKARELIAYGRRTSTTEEEKATIVACLRVTYKELGTVLGVKS